MKAALVSALCLLAARAAASQGSAGVGSESSTWLDLPNSARTAALAGATAALGGDLNSVSLNPADLATLKDRQLSLMYNDYIQGMSLEHIAYGQDLGAGDGLALSVDYMDYGSIAASTVTNGVLVPNGSINPYGLAADLGYGHAFGRLSVGGGLKVVTESLSGGSSAATLGGDLGVLWRQGSDGLSGGLALQNFGGTLEGASLPTQAQASLAYGFSFPGARRLNLVGAATVPTADPAMESLALGGEYSGGDVWVVRLGYKFVGDNQIGGLSAGGGIKYGIVGFDYAFVAEGVLGNANEVSLSTDF